MSVAVTNTLNTMGVRTLAGTRSRSYRSSHPRLSGYVTLRGPAYGLRGEDSFSAGTPLEADPLGDVYSIGTLPDGIVGYSPDGSLGYTQIQPSAPAGTGTQSGGGSAIVPISIANMPASVSSNPSALPQPATGSSAGGTFPIWVAIAVLVAAALILPPLIKKL